MTNDGANTITTTTCQRRHGPSLTLSLTPCSWAAPSTSLSLMRVSARVHADHESVSVYALTGMPSLPLLAVPPPPLAPSLMAAPTR